MNVLSGLPEMRVKKLNRILDNLLHEDRVECVLEDKRRAQIEELTDRKVLQRMARDQAHRQALMEARDMEQIKRERQKLWLGYGVETTLQDVRYACRSLLSAPGFAVVVIMTLALGITVTLSMFSVMRAVLLRPLPYPDPDRIVMIQVDARNTTNAGATLGEVSDLREHSRSLEQVAIISTADASLEYVGGMEHVNAAEVSDDFLPLLGARPAIGRPLDSQIDASPQQAVAVLISDELWRRRFSADPGIIGRGVRINNLNMQVVGVLPPGFRLFLPPSVNASEQIDVWFPYRINTALPYRGIPVAARLRQGVALDQANAELQMFVAQFERKYPEAYAGVKGRFTARLLHNEITREARPALLLLAGAVGFVLVIACVNVANLMLARGSARQRELEIRRALGAGTGRILRQLLTESLVLGMISAALGLLCARFGVAAIGIVGASHIPLHSRIDIDAPVQLCALALAVITTLLFGLLPAWRMASGKPGHPLGAGRTETAGSSARRLQQSLVVAEVALSIVPLAGAGLMLRTFLNLLHSPLGFHPSGVVTANVPVDEKRHPHLEQRWTLLRDMFDRVRGLPGVQSVSAAWPLPLAPDQQTRRVGSADQIDAPPLLATQQFATPGYLNVVGTPLREGRDFTADDVKGQRNVAIIDELLAKWLWPTGAIGKRLAVYRTGRTDQLEIVGVTAALRVTRVRDANMPHFMIPYSTYPPYMSLVVKTTERPDTIAREIKAVIDSTPVGRAAFDIQPMSRYVSDSMGDTRFIFFVLSAFAGASVLLTAVGLYGTLAYLTMRRNREFGVRLALGSGTGAIMAIVVRQSVFLAAAGVAMGLIGVAVVTRAMRELLYGVQPLDGVTLAGVVTTVGIVALGAASVPAWRAAHIDPQLLLRSE